MKEIALNDDLLASRRFDFVRKELVRGFRSQRMGAVIAELRVLRRQQLEGHFPAMILDARRHR
jgi:transposase-like protein